MATASSDFSNQITHYLKATNFSFSIPSTATVNGIVVEIKRRYQNLSSGTNPSVVDSRVRIIKADGSIGSTDKASASTWPSSLAYATYGGSSDLWGETWTPADINDADFGVAIAATSTSNADGDDIFIRVDHARIAVHYTPLVTNATQAVEGSLLSAGRIVFQAQTKAAAALTPAGLTIKKPSRVLTGTLASSGALKRAPQRLLFALSSFSGTLTKVLFRKVRKIRARVTVDRGPSAVVKVRRRR